MTSSLQRLVLDSLATVKVGVASDPTATAALRLYGEGGLLDSIDLVALIIAIEQAVEAEHGVTVVLASEMAMSRRSSPFATIGALVDYVGAQIQEAQSRG